MSVQTTQHRLSDSFAQTEKSCRRSAVHRRFQATHKSLGSLAAILLSVLCFSARPMSAQSEGQAARMFKQAQSDETQSRFDQAAIIYRRLISDPNAAPALKARSNCRLAVIYSLQGKMEQVFSICDKLTTNLDQTAKQDPEFMVDLDDLTDYLLEHEKDSKVGMEALYRTLKLRTAISPNHPHIPEVYMHLSSYFAQRKYYDEAIKCAKEAIKSEQNLPISRKARTVGRMARLSTLYLAANNMTEAEKELRDGLAILDKCSCGDWMKSSMHYSLGMVMAERGRLDEADEQFRRGIEDYRKNPDKSLNVAECCQQALKRNETTRQLKKNKPGGGPHRAFSGTSQPKLGWLANHN